MAYWDRSRGTMTRAEKNMWEWRQMMEQGDNELRTIQRYADTKEGQAERLKAWFAPIEEAEYYLTKGRAYERPTSHVSR